MNTCPDCRSDLRADGSCPMCDEETPMLGGIIYDDDEDEDGGWAISKDHSASLWDSADDQTEEKP